jgi:hypothetical protein
MTSNMSPELEQQVARIENLRDVHTSLANEMLLADGDKFFAIDFLAAAVIKRSMSLCSGFSTLVRGRNYTSAAAILRLQLDSCLRFYAAFIVADPHFFATEILRGVPVRRMVDKSGAKMTDKYLVEKLGRKFEWMPRVYDSTSGFVHLSERHIYATGNWSPDKVSLLISPMDEHIAVEFWIEMAMCFLACTDALFEYLRGWVFTKGNPELVARMREQHAS